MLFGSKAAPSFLFPVTFLLPDNTLCVAVQLWPHTHSFLAANKLAMKFDWQANKETYLPSLKYRVNYPWSAGSAALALTPENSYTPEVVLFGGSNLDDQVDPSQLSSQTPAISTAARMRLDDTGIAAGWQYEQMPSARIMGGVVQLPDGKLLIVNGAQTGAAGCA